MTKFERLVLEGLRLILMCVVTSGFTNLTSYKNWRKEVDEATRNEHF